MFDRGFIYLQSHFFDFFAYQEYMHMIKIWNYVVGERERERNASYSTEGRIMGTWGTCHVRYHTGRCISL